MGLKLECVWAAPPPTAPASTCRLFQLLSENNNFVCTNTYTSRQMKNYVQEHDKNNGKLCTEIQMNRLEGRLFKLYFNFCPSKCSKVFRGSCWGVRIASIRTLAFPVTSYETCTMMKRISELSNSPFQVLPQHPWTLFIGVFELLLGCITPPLKSFCSWTPALMFTWKCLCNVL